MKRPLTAAIFAMIASPAFAAKIVSANEKENLSVVISESVEGVSIQLCDRSGEQCRAIAAQTVYPKEALMKQLRHYRLTGQIPSRVAFAGTALTFYAAIASGGTAAPLIIFPAALGMGVAGRHTKFQTLDKLIKSLAAESETIEIEGSVKSFALNLRSALPL